MSYQAFEGRWIGRRNNYDSVYGYQCVDLIKVYVAEEFGLKPGAWGNAIDYWTRTNQGMLGKFTRVASNSVKQGDIVVINGTSSNRYGHIVVATGGQNGTSFEALEQNGSAGNGSGTGGDAIRKRWIARNRVAGILRPKVTVTVTVTAPKGGNDMITRKGLEFVFINLLGRNPDAGAYGHYVGKYTTDFVIDDVSKSGERNTVLAGRRANEAARLKQIKDLQVALTNEKNKPPKEIVKEVEKIVERVVEIKVGEPIDETAVVRNWFGKLVNKLIGLVGKGDDGK